MTLCPQGPPVSLGGHGDTSWCHVLEGHGDVGQTWGHPTFMSPRATGVPWGTWGHRGRWDRHGDSVNPCPQGPPVSLPVSCPRGTWGHGTDMGTPPGAMSSGDMGTWDRHGDTPTSCPQGSPVSLGGHGDTGGTGMDRHGDTVTLCHHGPPASSGDMGTRDGHEDSLTSCPQGSLWGHRGTWGHHRSVSPRVLCCPQGMWGHRVTWGHLGSVSPSAPNVPRDMRPSQICVPRGHGDTE